jgi:hypothetical protein
MFHKKENTAQRHVAGANRARLREKLKTMRSAKLRNELMADPKFNMAAAKKGNFTYNPPLGIFRDIRYEVILVQFLLAI